MIFIPGMQSQLVIRGILTSLLFTSKSKNNIIPIGRNSLCLFKEFHYPNVENATSSFESRKPSFLCQRLELLLSSLFSTNIVRQHGKICIVEQLCFGIAFWGFWKKTVCDDHLPIVWKSLPTVLQYFQAKLITPIMKNPLQVS